MGADRKQELSEIARQERQRLESGGYLLSFEDMQRVAKELSDIDKELEILSFRVLESINDEYERWRIYKAAKEKQLGRPMTAQEIADAHKITGHEKEEVTTK